MAGVDRRLRKLEARLDAHAAAEAAAQEAGWLREVREVAGRLGTEDLRAVVAVLDDALGVSFPEEAIREEAAEAPGAAAGSGGDLSDALRALRGGADERGRRALDAALEILAELRGGAGEQQRPSKGDHRP